MTRELHELSTFYYNDLRVSLIFSNENHEETNFRISIISYNTYIYKSIFNFKNIKINLD